MQYSYSTLKGISVKQIVTIALLAFSSLSYASSWSPSASIQVTTPQRYSFSIGISGVNLGSLFGSDSGILLRLEPGLSGVKLHLGKRGVFSFLMLPMASVETTVAIMHTWNDPWNGIQEDQTYAGLEARYTIMPILITAGYYRHLAGVDTEHDWIGSFGAGIGL